MFHYLVSFVCLFLVQGKTHVLAGMVILQDAYAHPLISGNFPEFRDVNIVIGAFICFVMPLLVCAAGAFAGHFLALSQGFDTVQTAVIGGVIGFMIGAVGVKLFDRSLSKEESSKPKIIEICY